MSPRGHLNFVILGLPGHGTSTLSKAICATYDGSWDDPTPSVATGFRIDAPTRSLAFMDPCPERCGASDLMGYMASADAYVLNVSAPLGITPRLQQYPIIAFANRLNAPVIFLNQADKVSIEALAELKEAVARSLSGLINPDKVLFVEGITGEAAVIARSSIEAIIDACNAVEPKRSVIIAPLRMPVSDVYLLPDAKAPKTALAGRIMQGRAKAGDKIEIIGGHKRRQAEILELLQHAATGTAYAGENAVFVIEAEEGDDQIGRNHLVARPNSIAAQKRFEAKIYCLEAGETKRPLEPRAIHRLQVFFGTMEQTGLLHTNALSETAQAGVNLTIPMELIYPTAIEVGMLFLAFERGELVAMGAVTEILDPPKESQS